MTALPVAPDAVRVWRGFKFDAVTLPDFLTQLGTVFVPSTVELQANAGLHAYIPTIAAGLPDKPERVPDETALVFWERPETYRDGFRTLAVRAYHLTHGACYTPASRADFPIAYAGELAENQPYYLVDAPADWMDGPVTHLLAARPPELSSDAYRAALAQRLSALAASPGLAGGLVCAGPDYLAGWFLGTPDGDALGALAADGAWQHVVTPVPTQLPKGLWDDWPGLTLASGDSLNIQFERRRPA